MRKDNKENERIGEIRYNKNNSKMEIVEYYNSNKVKVKFNDSAYEKYCNYYNFLHGKVISPLDKIVYNRGFIGLGVFKYDKTQKVARTWYGMFVRCYSEKYHKKKPTYIDCEVCKEWLCFQNFAQWYNDNYYEIEGEEMHLDKDILYKGNKTYCPNNCIFVPKTINLLFTKCDKARGRTSIGTSFDKSKDKFISQCSDNANNHYLGQFNTEIEAFMAYKQFKEQYIKEVAEEYKNKIPNKLYEAMYKYEVNIND